MAALGIGLVYLGYCGGLWGVFLITGKNVSFAQLFSSTWPPDSPSVGGGTNTEGSAGGGATPSSPATSGTGQGPSGTTTHLASGGI